MDAVVWTDYICPWCYLGRDRTLLMRRLGVDVTSKPYELHPDLPVGGRPLRSDGRLARVYDGIEAECVELGLPFRRPERTPNSRQALETAEVVRIIAPESYERLDDALFRAHWVDGLDLGDDETLDTLVEQAGVSVAAMRELRSDGGGRAAVEASMSDARDLGVTATPTWLVGPGLLIPGAQPRETVERWISRLLEREKDEPVTGRLGP